MAVDLRPDSPTHGQWFGAELDAAGEALYIPGDARIGFQTLVPDTDVFYAISAAYAPEAAAVRWDDPLRHCWPDAPERVINSRDRSWPDYRPAAS